MVRFYFEPSFQRIRTKTYNWDPKDPKDPKDPEDPKDPKDGTWLFHITIAAPPF